jgi:hypothetical protein
MTTANPCSAPSFATPRFDTQPSIQGTREYLVKAWQAWRERRALRAKWLVLDELCDATRRDLGLGERRPDAPAALSLGWTRGPWL